MLGNESVTPFMPPVEAHTRLLDEHCALRDLLLSAGFFTASDLCVRVRVRREERLFKEVVQDTLGAAERFFQLIGGSCIGSLVCCSQALAKGNCQRAATRFSQIAAVNRLPVEPVASQNLKGDVTRADNEVIESSTLFANKVKLCEPVVRPREKQSRGARKTSAMAALDDLRKWCVGQSQSDPNVVATSKPCQNSSTVTVDERTQIFNMQVPSTEKIEDAFRASVANATTRSERMEKAARKQRKMKKYVIMGDDDSDDEVNSAQLSVAGTCSEIIDEARHAASTEHPRYNESAVRDVALSSEEGTHRQIPNRRKARGAFSRLAEEVENSQAQKAAEPSGAEAANNERERELHTLKSDCVAEAHLVWRIIARQIHNGEKVASLSLRSTDLVRHLREGIESECGGHVALTFDRSVLDDAATLHHAGLHDSATVFVSHAPPRFVVTASGDGVARIWQAESGRCEVQSVELKSQIHDTWLSGTCAHVLVGLLDGTAEIWNVHSSVRKAALVGHRDKLCMARFSSDFRLVITACADSTAKLWQVDTERCLHTLSGHGDAVLCACFSPDGTRVVTASIDETLRMWTVDRGMCVAILRGHNTGVLSACFSPDGARLLSTCTDGPPRLWKGSFVDLYDDLCMGPVVEAESEGALVGHVASVTQAAFSPDYHCHQSQKWVATAGADGVAILWQCGEVVSRVHILRGHSSAVLGIAFPPHASTTVASVSADHTTRIWEVSSGRCLHVLRSPANGHPSKVAFSKDALFIVTACVDGVARLWRSSGGDCLQTYKCGRAALINVQFHSDQ